VDYWPLAACAVKIDDEQINSPSRVTRHVAAMTRSGRKLSCVVLMMLAIGGESANAQKIAGPQGPERGVIRQQTWLIPAQDRSTLMWTDVFRPPGDGPFPLAVIAHGSTQNELRRMHYPLPQYQALAEWLVARGYTVAVPQRPGHGETGGPYYEDQHGCANADFRNAGLNAAAAIDAAIGYMIGQKFVRRDAIVFGQSAGGWGALALASRNVRPVRAVVAFAAGRGGRVDGAAGKNCAPDRLVAAAGEFGRTARMPTLWIYAENDSHFAPALSKRMVDAFRIAGGRAKYLLLPAIGTDGHELVHDRDAVEQWGPIVETFLRTAK
jgi:dienelactone hydrolase